MSPKTGRPLSDNARKAKVETRMSEDELKKLDFCCKVTGKTRSEIVREGIETVYAKLNILDKK